MPFSSPCPCGRDLPYDQCCGVYHRGEAQAPTAGALMRARYSAFAIGDADYVFQTWHPATRPQETALPVGLTWLGLDIEDVINGTEHDDLGEVTFSARYRDDAGRQGRLREHSRFTRKGGRWMYLDGDVAP